MSDEADVARLAIMRHANIVYQADELLGKIVAEPLSEALLVRSFWQAIYFHDVLCLVWAASAMDSLIMLVLLSLKIEGVLVNGIAVPVCDAHQSIFEFTNSATLQQKDWRLRQEPDCGAGENLKDKADCNEPEPIDAHFHEPRSCKEVNAALKAVPDGADRVLVLAWHQLDHVKECSVGPDRVEDAPSK